MTVGSIGGTYGLSGSGMDIDAIVKKLMTGQQAKEDALIQKKTVLEWQRLPIIRYMMISAIFALRRSIINSRGL